LRSGRRYHERPTGLRQAVLDDPAKTQAGPAQAGSDGRHRDAEPRSDLLVRQAVDVSEHEGLPQPRAHVGQRRKDVAVREDVQVRRLSRWLGHQRAGGVLEVDLADRHSVPVSIREEVLHDPRQPGTRVRARPEAMTGAQGPLEGVLNQVLGRGLVANQHLGVGE
jgi:hypothetical protein